MGMCVDCIRDSGMASRHSIGIFFADGTTVCIEQSQGAFVPPPQINLPRWTSYLAEPPAQTMRDPVPQSQGP